MGLEWASKCCLKQPKAAKNNIRQHKAGKRPEKA
jgi:hypothetical protein